MEDIKDLEFLASKSSELVEKQINSYRHKHSNSGTIITVLALFIPFFINGLDDSYLLISYLAIIPIFLLVLAIISLLQVLWSKPLDQGFHINKFDDLVKKTHEDILLYEIGANKCSFIDNEKIIEKSNDKYILAIKLTCAAIIISTCLLLINQFNKPEKKPISVIIQNNKIMSEKDGKKTADEKPADKVRTIPYVPPKDRTNLNEDYKLPKTGEDGKKK